MGATKLCLLLLLGTALAQDAESDQTPICLWAQRLKNFRQYVYDYEAESVSGAVGTNTMTGPKVFCKVQVDVPQTCRLVLRTTDCSLSSISALDAEGRPVYRPAEGSEAFKDAMAKNVLKIEVDGTDHVSLYPENKEPKNILDIKRGIINALLSPEVEEDVTRDMPTVYGYCPTDIMVKDTDAGVTVTRDIHKCGFANANKLYTSPLALITGMESRLSKMISSKQICDYKFDAQKKFMTHCSCTEKHLYQPLPSNGAHGLTAEVKQTMVLRNTVKINDRTFEPQWGNFENFFMEEMEDKSTTQNKDVAIMTLQRLRSLSQTPDNQERAGLFNKLVTELRGLKAEVLTSAAVEMNDISTSLTFQALVQCGTPECTGAFMKVLKTFDNGPAQVDATVYALGMLQPPSDAMVMNMLDMAQHRKSQPVMYALGKTVRKMHEKTGAPTPGMKEVSKFITSVLGTDCAGEKDLTYLTLRVLGNIGDIMEAVDPAIQSTLVKCMRQPSTSLYVQLAAIQAFRRMSVTSEIRSNLQRVSQYPKGAVQKRLAAYLVLMRHPEDSDMEMVKKLLTQEQNTQVKAFVSSHIYNIISSTDPDLNRIGQLIREALKDIDVSTHSDFTTKSRNYDLSLGYDRLRAAVFSNVIFDPSNQLPREVMLETTLKAFGFDTNIWEVGMEGKGFEPSFEALFGKNGFFPDTVSKAIYWAEDKMPPKMKEVLEKWVAPFKTPGQKIPENLEKEIVRNFNKLMKDLQSQESPEAMAYLRSMGEELGFIRGSDLKSVAENARMFINLFMRVLPSTVMKKLMSEDDHELFIHYMFMDNKFMMPTAAGLPLTFAMTGTFAPGAKGGFRVSPDMKELLFVPSAGVEFVTRMGVHMPEFVDAAAERHTTLYHESVLDAKLSMSQSKVKLSIPTPKGPIKLLRVSNKVAIVGNDQAVKVPDSVKESNCKPVFSGVKLCVTTLRTDTGDLSLIGDNVLAVDIMPTSEVSEYTATLTYQLRQEEDFGLHNIDSLTLALRAEGTKPTEATAVMTYNRKRNIFSTEVQIPDMDVQVGFKAGFIDRRSKGMSIDLEFTNKNLPQLTLFGLVNFKSLTDRVLQFEMVVPPLSTNAAVTATFSKDDGIAMELKSEVKVVESSSVQSVTFKYGEEQAEVQLVSNVNSDTKNLVDSTEALQVWLRQSAEAILDQHVVKTDMKLRHILNKGVEASNIWMDKIAKDAPYVQTLRSSLTDLDMPSLPEKLFMNFESQFRYKFNKDRFTMTVPLPLGGSSSHELWIPTAIITSKIPLPDMGLNSAPTDVQFPTFTIPYEYDLSLPLMGMVDMSAKVNSNFYVGEATFSAGNNTVESMSYETKFNMKTESTVNILSFSTAVESKLMETEDEKLIFSLNGDLNHMLVKTGVSVLETVSITDSVHSTGKSNVYITSPLGLDTSLTVTPKLTLAHSILSVDVNTDGSITVGSKSASSTYLHTFSVEPVKKEARLESNLKVTSDFLKVSNKIDASYAKEALLMESVTDLNSVPLKHKNKMSLSYKDDKLNTLCDFVTKADGKLFHSQFEVSANNREATLRIENEVDDTENRGYSLITGSINPSGLEVNADASLVFLTRVVSHKGTFSLNMNGLTTSCTTTAQSRPMTFENVFHGAVDSSGVSTSLTTKGSYGENKAELSVEGKIATTEISFNGIVKGNIFEANAINRVVLKMNGDGLILSNNMVGSFKEMRTENTHSLSLGGSTFKILSKTDNVLDKSNSYKHDISVEIGRYVANVVVKNDLKIMEVNFINDAQFKAEPIKLELVGTLMGVYSEEELKHTYEIKFAELVFSAKCKTNGKLLGTHVTHTADIEVAGLSVKFNDVANINSPSLRLESTVKTVAEPFDLNIDAIFNSDGQVSLYGQHSGEVYSKFLLKAKPLLYTQSFEYRASTSHKLEGRAPLKTSIDNKIDNLLSFNEQRFTLRIKSKVNDNTVDQEIKSYNNAEKMGFEVSTELSTPFFSGSNQEYSISGFLKYDKNSNSHFILVPFDEYFPRLVENAMSAPVELIQYSVQMVKSIDSKYKVSETVRNKLSELKEVVENFDFNIFVQDLRMFLHSVEEAVNDMIAKFPSKKIMNTVKIIKKTVMAWMQKYNIADKFTAIYTRIESILSEYEIEKMIEAIMDKIVEMMKQYQLREKIQSVFAHLRSIDLQPLFKKTLSPVQGFVNTLYDFDFQQLVADVSEYLMKTMEEIKSVKYDLVIADLKVKPVDIVFPCFGKLYGEFKLKSPHYKLKTTADLENTTTTSEAPEFKMGFNSVASSTLKVLDYTVDASARFALNDEDQLSVSEEIAVDSSCFTLNHKETTVYYALTSSETSIQTSAAVTTELYTAELANKASYGLNRDNDFSCKSETNYKHHINIPPLGIFSEALMNLKTDWQVEDGKLHLTHEHLYNDKYAVMSFSDEANHKSSTDVVTDFQTAKVTFNGESGFIGAKMIHTLTADMRVFDHLTIVAKAETEAPFMKNSVAEAKFQAKAVDMKIDFEASHSAEMIGLVEGPVSNMALVSIKPNELVFSTKNKGNAKVYLPFQLSGKLDLQNDFSLNLNSRIQQTAWEALAKFNQYKYFHNFTVDNTDEEIQMSTQVNGAANLDFLKETIIIPEIKVPYFDKRIPKVNSFSPWRDFNLKFFLITTQQTIDINTKVKYKKNPEVIEFNLEPAFNTLYEKAVIGRDNAAAILAASYNKAKAEYEKYSNELPSGFTLPAYRVPVVDVGLTLPEVTLPQVQTVQIPKMGDLTYDFSMKSAVVTLKADASILNRGSIDMKLDISSISEHGLLEGNVQGQSSIRSDGGFKMTSSLTSKYLFLDTAHDSTVLLSCDKVDASISNSAEFLLPTKYNHRVILNSEEGLVTSLSSSTAGRLSLQVQAERPTQVKASLYGSYPSEPTKNIEILGLNMALRGSEMPIVETTYNMEIPNSMLRATKREVRNFASIGYDIVRFVKEELLRLKKHILRDLRDGKRTLKRALDHLAEVKPSEVLAAVSDNTLMILQEYQEKVKAVLDAVYTFLEETKFHVPGYNQRLSGFEIYDKLTEVVADVCEEALEKIPEYFKMVCDYILSIELPSPLSDFVLKVKEICTEFSESMPAYKQRALAMARKVANIRLEDIMSKISELSQIMDEQSERLVQSLKSVNTDQLSAWFTEAYNSAINCPHLNAVVTWIRAQWRMFVEYLNM